jgi:hypothetical protein
MPPLLLHQCEQRDVLACKAFDLLDVTLAVLCRDGKQPDVIRRVVTRIATAPASEQSDALIKLSVLSDLRGIGPRVQSEVEKMGLPVNLEESTLLRGTLDRVRTETSIDDILDSGRPTGRPQATPGRSRARRTQGCSPPERDRSLRRRGSCEAVRHYTRPLIRNERQDENRPRSGRERHPHPRRDYSQLSAGRPFRRFLGRHVLAGRARLPLSQPYTVSSRRLRQF